MSRNLPFLSSLNPLSFLLFLILSFYGCFIRSCSCLVPPDNVFRVGGADFFVVIVKGHKMCLVGSREVAEVSEFTLLK